MKPSLRSAMPHTAASANSARPFKSFGTSFATSSRCCSYLGHATGNGHAKKAAKEKDLSPEMQATEAKMEAAAAKLRVQELTAKVERLQEEQQKSKDSWASDLKAAVRMCTLTPEDVHTASAAKRHQAGSGVVGGGGASRDGPPNTQQHQRAAVHAKLSRKETPGEQLRSLVSDYEEEKSNLETRRAEQYERAERLTVEMDTRLRDAEEKLENERQLRSSEVEAATSMMATVSGALKAEIMLCEGEAKEGRHLYAALERKLAGVQAVEEERADIECKRLRGVLADKEAEIRRLNEEIVRCGEVRVKMEEGHQERLAEAMHGADRVKGQLLSCVSQLSRAQAASKHGGYFFSAGSGASMKHQHQQSPLERLLEHSRPRDVVETLVFSPEEEVAAMYVTPVRSGSGGGAKASSNNSRLLKEAASGGYSSVAALRQLQLSMSGGGGGGGKARLQDEPDVVGGGTRSQGKGWRQRQQPPASMRGTRGGAGGGAPKSFRSPPVTVHASRRTVASV